jgi:plastocyanin
MELSKVCGIWLGLLGGTASTVVAQSVHEIRLEVNAEDEQYSFIPSAVTARPGDVLLFRVTNGAPHSVVFEPGGLAPAARAALNGALPRRSADLSSPLLTENGAEYRMVVPQLSPGTYRFFCLPHRAYDMRGELRVVAGK